LLGCGTRQGPRNAKLACLSVEIFSIVARNPCELLETARKSKNLHGGLTYATLPRSMSSYRLIPIVLVGALVMIVPVAHGSPPDPIWIAGVYDHADGDEAVQAISDGVAFRSSATIPSDVTPLRSSSPSPCSALLAPLCRPVRSSHADRAPPLR